MHDQVVEKNQRRFLYLKIKKFGEGANNSWYTLNMIEIIKISSEVQIPLILPYLGLTLSAFH